VKKVTAILLFLIPVLIATGKDNAIIPWKAPVTADELKNPFANDPAAAEKGKKIFSTVCNVCHGDKGKGDGIGGAAINPKPANFTSANVQSQTDGALFWKLTNGRGPMVSYKPIYTDEQRWQLVNYIRLLGKGGKK
jgi:mono/diheme cytochrome c family protein